jgi:hypothetical protein
MVADATAIDEIVAARHPITVRRVHPAGAWIAVCGHRHRARDAAPSSLRYPCAVVALVRLPVAIRHAGVGAAQRLAARRAYRRCGGRAVVARSAPVREPPGAAARIRRVSAANPVAAHLAADVAGRTGRHARRRAWRRVVWAREHDVERRRIARSVGAGVAAPAVRSAGDLSATRSGGEHGEQEGSHSSKSSAETAP